MHVFCLAVDRVQQGTAVVHPQSPFHGFDVGSIDLEGHGSNGLESQDHLFDEGRFIHPGNPHVHVQHLGPLVQLFQGQLAHIVHVLGLQGLFQPRFPGRIDPFPDDHRHPFEIHRRPVAGNGTGCSGPRCREGDVPAGCDEPGNVVRSGSAAAPQHGDPGFRKGHHERRIARSIDVEHGLPVLLDRQPRIGISHQRDIHRLESPGHQLHQSVGTLAAVEAHSRCPQGFRHHKGCSHIRPIQQLPVFVKGKGAHDGQLRIFLGRQDGCFGFIAVAHGFDQDQVRSSGISCLDLLGIQGYCLLERQVSKRLEQFPSRPQVQGHKTFPAFRPESGPGIFHPGPDQFFHFRLAVGRSEFQPIGPEGIGL